MTEIIASVAGKLAQSGECGFGPKEHYDLRPKAQGFDEVRIFTVPRYKQSGLSGDEWRISATIQLWRKGKMIVERHCGTLKRARAMARYDDPWKHDWSEDYYGLKCRECGMFVPYGCEPWVDDPNPDHDAVWDDDGELDDEPDANCMGWFCEGRFTCGAVGSEDCDWCPNYWMLGMTAREAQAQEEREMLAESGKSGGT